jgi:26S proteasome regulatory subunit N9
MHPILNSLDNTPHDWLKKLLITFNEGNIGKFESLSPLFSKEVRRIPLFSPNSTLILAKPLLQQNSTFLRQKICLMALIELVFKRMGSSSESKVLTFQVCVPETNISTSLP